MNLDFQQHIPADFPDNSRVWIYQCNRTFSTHEALQVEDMIKDFCCDWKSHGDEVKAYANLFFGQFVILMADESQSGVSGCSTDSSVRLIKSIEGKFQVNMFDRQTLAFITKERMQLLPLAQLSYAIENNFITPDTLYFNNTVLTKKDLLERWIVPLKDSWLASKITAPPILPKGEGH